MRAAQHTTGAVALALMIALGAGASAGARERASRQEPVNESAHLHLVKRHGTTVSEQGTGSGTFAGPITLRIEANESSFTFTFTCRTRFGEVEGAGHIRLHVANPTSSFTGSVALTHGTGRYAHVSSSRLTVSGTVVTSSYATTLRAHGSMRL